MGFFGGVAIHTAVHFCPYMLINLFYMCNKEFCYPRCKKVFKNSKVSDPRLTYHKNEVTDGMNMKVYFRGISYIQTYKNSYNVSYSNIFFLKRSECCLFRYLFHIVCVVRI